VQNNFRALLDILLTAGRPFCAGTHDPELLEWMKDRALQDKSQVDFDFLKGLEDEIKLQMAKEKWRGTGYVPFGQSASCALRRERCLKELQSLGRELVH
jgi:hypothetical protein